MNKKQKTEFEKEVARILEFVNLTTELVIVNPEHGVYKFVEQPKKKSWLK